MSAYDAKLGCVNCGADLEFLNPKSSGEAGVYTCECEKCGYRDLYIYPEEPIEEDELDHTISQALRFGYDPENEEGQ